MRLRFARIARVAPLLFALAACGTPPPDLTSADAGGATLDPGFQMMLSTPWSLPANSEQYYCLRVTVQQDIWVKSIKPISPPGTHHSVLMLAAHPSEPDGLTECSSLLTDPAIFASGVGTTELDFPDGIGLHITAGEQLFMNLHLFNSTGDTLTGTSGVEYEAADPSTIVHEAGSVLAGKATGATVPVGENVQLAFTCTTPADTVMFAVAPHMHLYGTHLDATYNPGGGAAPITVLDTDYEFDDQKFRMIEPSMVTTVAGGQYDVTCTYTNESGAPVPFGESTTEEMCFAMTYVYPPPTAPVCSK